MPESAGFVAHAVDLLSRVGPVRARAMFGGHGIYCGALMIGLVDDDEIFLKTDAGTRPRFEEAGCRQWVFTGGRKEMRSSYFRPPDEAHESQEDMEPWGRLALEAARRAAAAKRAGKPGKPKAKAAKAKGGKKAKRPLPPLPLMRARELVDVSSRDALGRAHDGRPAARPPRRR